VPEMVFKHIRFYLNLTGHTLKGFGTLKTCLYDCLQYK
jgi:hypothetical protein